MLLHSLQSSKAVKGGGYNKEAAEKMLPVCGPRPSISKAACLAGQYSASKERIQGRSSNWLCYRCCCHPALAALLTPGRVQNSGRAAALPRRLPRHHSSAQSCKGRAVLAPGSRATGAWQAAGVRHAGTA